MIQMDNSRDILHALTLVVVFVKLHMIQKKLSILEKVFCRRK